jgi:hypothetical protein
LSFTQTLTSPKALHAFEKAEDWHRLKSSLAAKYRVHRAIFIAKHRPVFFQNMEEEEAEEVLDNDEGIRRMYDRWMYHRYKENCQRNKLMIWSMACVAAGERYVAIC